MKTLITLCAAALVAVISAPAAAESKKATGKEAPAHVFSRTVLPEATYTEKLDRMVQAIRSSQPAARLKTLSPDFWQKLRAGLEKLLPYQEMVDDGAGEFARHYTPDELKRLLAFYESPLGKKALREMPLVMAQSSAIVEKHMDERLPPLLQDLMKTETPSPSAPPQGQQ